MMMLMLMLMLLLLLLLMMMKQIIPTGLTEDSIPGPNRDQSGNMTGGFATELIWEFLAVPPQSAAVLAEGGSFATDPIKGPDRQLTFAITADENDCQETGKYN